MLSLLRHHCCWTFSADRARTLGMATHSWRIPQILVGYSPWGLRVGHDWSDLAYILICVYKHICVYVDILYLTIYICAQSLSRVQLSAAPWTVAHQAPLSIEFLRQEYWSGLPFPAPGHLPNPGIDWICLLSLLHWQVNFLPLMPRGMPQRHIL